MKSSNDHQHLCQCHRQNWCHHDCAAALLIATRTKPSATLQSSVKPPTLPTALSGVLPSFLPSFLPSLLIDFFQYYVFGSRIPTLIFDVFPARGQEHTTNCFAGTCKQAQNPSTSQHGVRPRDWFSHYSCCQWKHNPSQWFHHLQNNAKQGEVVGGCGCQTRSSDYEHKRITKGVDEWKFNVVTVQPSITGRLGLQIFTRPRPPASNPFSRPRLGSGTLHLCSNGGLQNSAANHDGHCLTWVKFWRDEIRLILSWETIDFEIPMVSQKCRVPIAMRDLKNDSQEHSKRGLNICPCQSKRRTQTSKLKNLSYHILSYFIPCIIYFPPRTASNPTRTQHKCKELAEFSSSVGQPWPAEQEVGEQPEALRKKFQA